MSGLSLLFNSRGLATQTHFGQTWAHLAIFIPKWSVLNLWRIQQIFPSLAVTSVGNTAFQPLSIFPHSVHFWMKVGLFLLKDLLIVSVYLGHGSVKKEDISSELIEVSSNLFNIPAYCGNMSIIYFLLSETSRFPWWYHSKQNLDCK